MKSVRLAIAAAALAFAAPVAQAQEWPLNPGDFVSVSMITVDDGHDLEYANHLAGQWRKSQDYAKAQGWITNYQIWTNEFARDGEADIWLVSWFPTFADPNEVLRREKAFNDYMKTTAARQEAESGKRATYRKLSGSMLLRNNVWAK
jgi:hypothetical protein